MQTKAILFDLDGVILDSEKEYRRFWMQAAEELGYPLTEDVVLRLRSCDSSIARKIVDEAAGESGAYDRVRARRKILMKDFLSEHTYELKPGVKAFLEKCRELPVRKVIVTSSRPEEKKPELERLGIGQYFDSFVSVKEVKRGKPFPDVYLFACRKLGMEPGECLARKLGMEPGECLAIEDSPNGVRSAYSAGVKVVMVPDLTGPTDELRRMCRVADRIEEVMEYLKK